jgi:hypothetical protein
VKVGEDLRGNVRLAIERLANGFLQSTPGLLARMSEQTEPVHYPEIGDLPPVQAFFHDVLTIIYRMLFLLFAEQRGMLPGRGSLYADEFSIVALRKRAERPVMEDEHLDLWERLLTTFRMIEKGAPELGVFGYNGALFGADRTPTLNQIGEGNHAALRNDALLRAVQSLTTINRDGVLQLISYLDLSVEEIGSIYESLLDFTPRIVTDETFRVSEDPKGLNPGEFFLDARGSTRKTTGSYYTHPALVNQEVQSALVPVLLERLRAAVPAFDENQVEALSEAERKKAETALLNLRVLDPSAGSGAFLISAMNVLALMLARIRAGDFYPAEREIRRARRDVLAHCLYAVDLNPMAVELCKVSLWINAAVEDAPLNFLDHHIKCGNSLVGVPPRMRTARASDSPEAGAATLFPNLPDEAFTPVADDDKPLARSARNENRKAREGQLTLWQMTQIETPEDLGAWSELTQLAEDDPKAAEARYLSLLEADDFQRRKLAADLWTAAFFWSFKSDAPRPPTTQSVRQAQADPKLLPAEMVQAAKKLADRFRFFHWELEFEEVFIQNNGFDVILGNPPWDMLQLDPQEYFSKLIPEISNATTQSIRERLVKSLEKTNPEVYASFQHELHYTESYQKFVHSSGQFPLTSYGRINLMALFAEAACHLINTHGRAGLILPLGIATDSFNQYFFSDIINKQSLVQLIGFENESFIFPDVHHAFKFCIFVVSGGEVITRSDFAFFCRRFDDLNNLERHFELSVNDFHLLNPNTLTCPTFRTKTDAEITKTIYRRVPVLHNEDNGANYWGFNGSLMFMMNTDSSFFITQTKSDYLPLYEAKLFHQFDHRWATYQNISQDDIRKGLARELTNDERNDPTFTPLPRFWVPKQEVEKRLKGWVYNWLICFRDITSSVVERTVISSIIPLVGVGNSAPVFITNIVDAKLNACLFANLNSLVLDFIARNKVGGTHLNFYILKQLPILPPSAYSPADIDFIAPRVLELVYTAHDLRPFAEDMGYHGEPFKWDESRRAQVRAELDATYARLYGLTRDELRYILDPKEVHGADFPGETFRVLKDKEIRLYGEYRTSRLVLRAWDSQGQG